MCILFSFTLIFFFFRLSLDAITLKYAEIFGNLSQLKTEYVSHDI